ncbi:site-specific DNA-methyltransferase [Bradyrhizobium elkanii]|uniref:site-specific DNA-methyltransferase n=1 Tax=Bradyrhizobium elkanii TaxID=29448 RepID=UPI00216885E4|nr:site-specific DNA-methyltransferase [Bradyrhizobium elkanii]MCS3521839.1 adenine-specific DNA-methyltransferase [Bradyrhizobium elkanii]MCS4069494.1 adenine-specific DNA-methyltransferase [Bradyrhizobium elkanii]MCS4076124.1 adenine-specific DNA-methyltransferase [Bradyrhizobium elkanii]MDH6687728.1 adenine-specific DNA-methyltransferase [Bradyrhizobium elkanii]
MSAIVKKLLRTDQEQSNPLDFLDKEDLIKLVKSLLSGGVALSFSGKRSALEIGRKVRPRVMRRESKMHVGPPDQQGRNLLIEGENLQAMVTLYKYRGQIDLIVTDPPYNTGQQFRYNDAWDKDPNDPDLGTLVAKDDGSRHTKWIKAMMPRLQVMKAMLKPSGVVAICIDQNELFHLGMLMDEVFGEQNRIAVINWQKTTPKPQSKNVSVTTEYVLVYCRDIALARTQDIERSSLSNARFGNHDNDELGEWKQDSLTGKGRSKASDYAVQSPFTGEFHDPGNRHWANKRSQMKEWLEEWGVEYEDFDLGDDRGRALALKGWSKCRDKQGRDKLLRKAREIAEKRLAQGNWPILYWGLDGQQKPVKKSHRELIKQGAVPQTFWLDDDEAPPVLGAVSWLRSMSGRSRDGIEELDEIVGEGHGFETVKPLRLIQKVIQIWCPHDGLILDPYAGSGTTGHAVLRLNEQDDGKRRFILIEQGAPDTGDKYARTLTWKRLSNAITGERPQGKEANPLGGAFEYRLLTKQIDAKTVLSMKKDELVDVVITSHWETSSRSSPGLVRIDDDKYRYLVGKNDRGEGYFIIWDGEGPVGQLDRETYKDVLKDAEKAALKPPYHVYARYEIYQSKNVQFWKIPDKILAHLGLNENSDRFNEED